MLDPFAALHLETAQRLDGLCDEFEQAWRSGSRPDIETYLARIESAQRGALLHDLLRIEAELLRGTGQVPQVAAYRHRFPDDVPIVEQAFDVQSTPAQIGRFEILGTLGTGAFGIVYRGRDPQLDRIVAIKVPRLSGADGLDRQQFLHEARSAATLRHPNICPIFEVGEADGTPYLVMACFEGSSLAEMIKQDGAWEELPASRLVRDLAAGLMEAHGKGIVHRDLKPANVLLDEQGVPIITDFGLAANVRSADAGERGQFRGTPAYTAPEHVAGNCTASPAWDIYALGVMLYELLAGSRPFRGPVPAVFDDILHGVVTPLAEVREGIDPRVRQICAKAMARVPEERYRSMRELYVAIDEYLATPAVSARWRIPWAIGFAIGAALLALVTTAALRNSRSPAPPTIGTATISSDREVAQWLLGLGAPFRIDVAGQSHVVAKAGSLPEGPFAITIVDLSDQTRLQDADLARLRPLVSLGSVVCTNTPITDEGLTHLAGLVQIEGLVLDGTGISDAGLQYLVDLKRLNSLSLNNLGLTGDGLDHLQHLPSLKRLSLSENPLISTSLAKLTRLEALEQLVLNQTAIGDAELKMIGDVRGLQALELCDTRISDAGLEHLSGLKHLRRLRLDRTQVTNTGLAWVSALAELEALTLDGTLVTGDGLPRLQPLTRLHSLSLNYCKLGRHGIAELQRLPELSNLSVVGVRISDEAVEALARLKRLQELNISRTRITAAGAERLQQALPESRIQR